MKKTKYLLMATLTFGIVYFSCKKSSEPKSAATIVEYRITPMNNYFTQITVDSIGAKVIITDPSQFINGSKTISISTKPFLARIETQINNTTPATISYTLAILVDHEQKNVVSVSAPPNATTTGSLEYTVQ